MNITTSCIDPNFEIYFIFSNRTSLSNDIPTPRFVCSSLRSDF